MQINLSPLKEFLYEFFPLNKEVYDREMHNEEEGVIPEDYNQRDDSGSSEHWKLRFLGTELQPEDVDFGNDQ